MTFWQATRQCIVNKYATCAGRASRAGLWSLFFPILFFWVIWLAMIECLMIWFGDVSLIDFVLLYAPFIFLPPLIAASVRRLHDIGKSGWLALALPVPFPSPWPALQTRLAGFQPLWPCAGAGENLINPSKGAKNVHF